jgi:putative ABC transport system permease protein
VLISGIIVIYSQLSYIKNKDLGFEKEQKLIFSFHTNDTKDGIDAFMNELKAMPEAKAVSKANNYVSQFVFNDMNVYTAGGSMATGPGAQFMVTDENFVKASGIKILSGRDFRKDDSTRILINETLAKKLGLNPATAPGTIIYSHHGEPQPVQMEIAGVMKDFNYNSLRDDVRGFMLLYEPGRSTSNVIVNTTTSNYKDLLGKMETAWHKNFPATPFEYVFLDDQVQKQYEAEITLSNIINSFTLIAILISCLGLFGLAAFSAEQRIKEIGIRKVLGASESGLVRLLSKDFLKLVIIAIVIAVPIAWWAMSKWLEAFAYRVPISWWMFAIAGLLAILIAMFTVSVQAIKAAIANPVKSLRSE